jgi:chromosome partitioning protein
METARESTPREYMVLVTDVAPAWKISVQGAHKFIKENRFQPLIVGKRAYLTATDARAAMQARGIEFKPQTICLQMLKGGVGKTTTALNVGIRASMYGARVLIIDLDQQANLSFAFVIEDETRKVWADVLDGDCTAESLIHEVTPNLHLIPSNLNNSVLDKILLNGKKNVAQGIRQPLASIRDNYELIIIDTAPNLSAINTAAACASDTVILPVNPDKFSFDGLGKTLADLEDIQREFSHTFETKVIFTKFDARETSSHALLKACLAEYGDIMLNSFVRTSSEFKNVIRSGQSIFSHKGPAKEDYDTVTRELLGLTD